MKKRYLQFDKSYNDIDLNALNNEIFFPSNDLYDLDIDFIIDLINNIDKKLERLKELKK